MTTTLSREGAIVQLEKLTARVCQCVADGGDTNALDLLMTTPSRPGDEKEATQVTVDSGVPGLGRLTQLWVVIGVLHGVMTKGKKLTQATHTATPPLPRADLLTCIWTCGVAARALVPHQADGLVREPRRGQPARPRRVWRSGRAVWRPLPARGPRRHRVAGGGVRGAIH